MYQALRNAIEPSPAAEELAAIDSIRLSILRSSTKISLDVSSPGEILHLLCYFRSNRTMTSRYHR